MEEKEKTTKGGKSKTLVDVEKFLAGQGGVDMSETKAAKNTQVGKKQLGCLQASQMSASQAGGLNQGNARAAARAAARAGKGGGDDDDDADETYTAAL